MEEYIELIDRVNNILNTAENIKNENERQSFFRNNISVFNVFKDSLHLILREFQFKHKDNDVQNEIVDKVKNNIVRLLNMKDVFERDDLYPHFKSELIEALSWNENKFAFNLQYEKDMSKVESALQYLQDRKEYINVLRTNELFEGQSLNESVAKKYITNEYEQNMFGHVLILLKNNFLSMSKDDVVRLLGHIDNSTFFKDLISKDNKKMNFYEKNLIYQYCETILKMKSIFTPDKLKDDEVIKKFWNGKIEDPKTLKSILTNISVYSFVDIYGDEQNKSTNGFLIDLANHFKDVNMSDQSISAIMKKIFDSQLTTYEYAQFLAKIELPNDYNEFLDSQYSDKFQWLTDFNTFKSLKDCEKFIENARQPFLPAEYYIKKLDKYNQIQGINEHFVGNLITLIHSDYYSQEEKKELIDALKRNGLYKDEYMVEKQITFDETDTPEITQEKVKQAYYSGQVVPIDIAQKLLNEDLSKQHFLDKATLQACVQGVISSTLQSNEIDIQNKVFFGEGHGKSLGYNDSSHKAIWIDDFLLEKYLNGKTLSDKADLFKTMFHEIQHAIQYHNMENGQVDYLTYNFIKEEIIEDYDPDFYDENYRSIFMESDARKGEILGTLDFFYGLNPDFVKTISGAMESEYISESEKHTLYTDAKKKISIGKDNLIDISEYVGLLIQNNPNILSENPILDIEYNPNGTKKDIETLLNEFEQRKMEGSMNYKKLYSIYYGLVMREKEGILPENMELLQRIDYFMKEEHDLITMEDMQNCYRSVDKTNMRQLYLRLYDTIRRNRKNRGDRYDDKAR